MERVRRRRFTLLSVSYLIAGGLIIYFFSEPFINVVVQLGSDIHLNPIVLAFFFAPSFSFFFLTFFFSCL
jgi:hypothetical protein